MGRRWRPDPARVRPGGWRGCQWRRHRAWVRAWIRCGRAQEEAPEVGEAEVEEPEVGEAGVGRGDRGVAAAASGPGADGHAKRND